MHHSGLFKKYRRSSINIISSFPLNDGLATEESIRLVMFPEGPLATENIYHLQPYDSVVFDGYVISYQYSLIYIFNTYYRH